MMQRLNVNVFFNRTFTTCPLQIEHEAHSCVLKKHEDNEDTFKDFDDFTVTLHHSENGQNISNLLDSSFVPAKNSKYF